MKALKIANLLSDYCVLDLEHVTLGNDHTMLMRGLLFLFYRWQSESQRLGDLLKVTQAVNGKD